DVAIEIDGRGTGKSQRRGCQRGQVCAAVESQDVATTAGSREVLADISFLGRCGEAGEAIRGVRKGRGLPRGQVDAAADRRRAHELETTDIAQRQTGDSGGSREVNQSAPTVIRVVE